MLLTYYMTAAFKLYKTWGAAAKLDHMEKLCSWLEVSMVCAYDTIPDIPEALTYIL